MNKVNLISVNFAIALSNTVGTREAPAIVIDFPIVGVNSARLRIQLMATHTVDQVHKGAEIQGATVSPFSSRS